MKNMVLAGAITLSSLALGVGAFAVTGPMALSVDQSGHVALAGEVSAVSGNTISVNSWLGTWVVNASSASIAPKDSAIADIKVGDTVKIAGTLGTGMAINATNVADLSLKAIIKKNNDDNGKHKGWLNLKFNGFFNGWLKGN